MGNHGDSSSTSLSESPSMQVKYTKISTNQMTFIIKLRPLSEQATHFPPPFLPLNVLYGHSINYPPPLPHTLLFHTNQDYDVCM